MNTGLFVMLSIVIFLVLLAFVPIFIYIGSLIYQLFKPKKAQVKGKRLTLNDLKERR